MLSTSVSMRRFNIASVNGRSSVGLVCAIRPYRRFADDRREAARSLWRYLGVRFASGFATAELNHHPDAAQPVRHEVVTHVLGAICHPCLRTRELLIGPPEGILTFAFGDKSPSFGRTSRTSATETVSESG
jgi:hypothetical protein